MKKFLIPLLAINLISGCAYYQGLHDQDNTAPATSQNPNAIHVKTQAAPKPMPSYNNNPTVNSAKMISPLTQ